MSGGSRGGPNYDSVQTISKNGATESPVDKRRTLLLSHMVRLNISNIPKDGQIIEKTDVWVVSELWLQSLVVEGLGWGVGV